MKKGPGVTGMYLNIFEVTMMGTNRKHDFFACQQKKSLENSRL
jgi:hypothetical protein